MGAIYLDKSLKYLLTTDHTAYCFGIDAEGNLQHIYWGKKLPREEDYPDCRAIGQTVGIGKNLENPKNLGLNDFFYPYEATKAVINEEYAGWGGLNFVEPSLKVMFEDGVRDLVLKHYTHQFRTESELVVTLKDVYYSLFVHRPVAAELQKQALEKTTAIQSGGDSYTAVSKSIPPADWKVVVLLSDAEIAAKTRWLYVAGILFAAAGLVVTLLLFFGLSRWIVRPFQNMIGVMKQVQSGNLQSRFAVTGNDEVAELGRALNNMIEQLHQLIDREYKAVLNQRNAEYRALQSQIRPHFLYNTLNGFIGLNRLKDSAGLETAIFALSDMLHYILGGSDWVRLSEEFAFIQKYCDLQRIRFRDRLTLDIHYEPAVESVEIPKLLLQPLVENAVIHGIEPASQPCMLRVSAELKQTGSAPCVKIAIQDNGCGFDPQSLAWKEGHGLSNVRERLALASREATFSLSSQVEVGTCVVIEIPLPSVPETPSVTASTALAAPDTNTDILK